MLERLNAEQWPVDEVVAFRELLYGLLRLAVTGHPPDTADLARLRDTVADAMTVAEFVTLFPARWRNQLTRARTTRAAAQPRV